MMGIFGVEKAARQKEVANAELYTLAVTCANFWVVYSKRECGRELAHGRAF